jgi:Protein of unknown function (DUF3752)
MPSVEPSLSPAQAAKRKRDAEDDGEGPISHSPRPPYLDPASPSSSAKKPRTIGPTLPPASLDERPSQSPERDSDSGSADDDFGPSLPTGTSQKAGISTDELETVSATSTQARAPATNQRDEWMIVPPSSGDWSERVDPTKLKNRKFNTGKGSKGPAQNVDKESNASWTETPDEKRARLQREMMGIKDISATQGSPKDDPKARENARKLREYNVSLMPQVSYFKQC